MRLNSWSAEMVQIHGPKNTRLLGQQFAAAAAISWSSHAALSATLWLLYIAIVR